MDDEIVWEDPPFSSRRRDPRTGVWVDRLAPLLEHPGKWAIVRSGVSVNNAAQTAKNLRRRIVKIPPGRFEFVARNGNVYGRYLGPEED